MANVGIVADLWQEWKVSLGKTPSIEQLE